MRVAALYDIHGNLPALEAVLADIARSGIDRIVVGGDVVCGPMTRGVLDRLRQLDRPVHFIHGNAEVAVLDEMAGAAHTHPFPEPILEVLRWEAAQLRAEQSTLAAWPKTHRMPVPGLGDVLFCHATPRDEDEIFVRTTPEEVLLPIFEPPGAAVVVCGHTHMQFDRRIGRVRVVNAGSVGMPFAPPGAYWLLLGPAVELRHTTYDLDRAVTRIRASGYPQAEQFATSYVLQPPSEAAMLQAFSGAALKA